MITAVQNDNVYIIRFPFDRDLITILKNIPGRNWDPEHKYWTIPVDRLGFLVANLQGTRFENALQVYSAEHLGENATLDSSTAEDIPEVDLSKVPLYVQEGGQLFRHQLDFMKYAIDRQRRGLYSGFILADQQGLGKTLEGCNLALYNKKFNHIKHCLIIACVNSAKYNWVEDIKKHTNGEYVPYLLGSRIKKDGTISVGGGAEKLKDLMCGHMYGDKNQPPLPFFIVINIEAMRMIQNRRYPIRERLTTLINKNYIGMIILDEIHRNCLDYNTEILTDKGLLPIGDIVTNKLPLKVWSYNIINKSYSLEPIVNWFENDLSENLLELTFDTNAGTKTIKCTPNHKFLTRNRGWVCAKDLLYTDDIVETEVGRFEENTD